MKNSHGGKKPRQSNLDGAKGVWPVTYKWIAMSTLVAYTAIGSRTIVLAAPQAGQKSSGRGQSETQAAVLPKRFAIPPGMLGEVLDAFEREAGIRVLVEEEGIRTLASPGVSGLCTAEEALAKLLAGTGVKYRFVAPETVRLSLAGVSQSVTVNAPASIVIPLPKFSEPVLDTPQTIGVVTPQIMSQQEATTLHDALRNVAGISLAAGEGGSQGDNLTIRGFTARNDIFLDGMRDFGSYYRDPFDLEEVAVLQGPSSVIFGRGSTGGVVSQASKTPELGSFIAGNLDTGTDLTRRLELDVNQALPQLGTGAAFRLNVMGNDSDVAGRDVAQNRRYGVAPALALGIGTPTRYLFSYFHQSEDDLPDYGVPWFFNAPAKVPRQDYYGFRNGNFLKADVNVGTAELQHDFNGAVTLSSQARYADYSRDVRITEPQIVSTITGAAVTPTTPLSQIAVTRHEIAADSVETFLDEQTDLTIRFQTGAVRHTFVTGVEADRETSDPSRPTYTNVPQTSLLDPNYEQAFAGTATVTSVVHTTAISVGAYALDTAKIGQKWEVTGGARWDRFAADYNQLIAPTSAFTRVDEMPSWRGALVYKPRTNASVYFDAGTSFDPSAESLSLSAATANLPPEKNLTYEVGTKWNLLASKLSVDGSLFRTDKTNAREPDPDNPLLDVLAGNQRVDGAELTVSGYLTDRWEILSSYAYLEGTVLSSQYYPAAVGAPLANVPKNTFNFWSTYEMPWHKLSFGAGTNYVDSRTASSTVPYDPTTGLLKEVPGYWVFNAMLEIPISERVYFQCNLYNLADRYYYDEIHPGHVVPGAGRSASFSLHFRFPTGKGN